MIKLIVSDLDGTLLQKGHIVKPTDQEALAKASAAGIIVSIASGRMHPEILHIVKDLHIQAHAISQNGAYVHNSAHELIQQDVFETELIKQLATTAAELPFYTILCAPDHYVITEMNEGYAALEANLLAPLKVMPHAVQALGSELICSKLSYIGPIEELLKLQQQLISTYGDKIDPYISDVNCLDVMPRHISKGLALQALQAYLGVNPEETICIGDSFNDISMFHVTPNSFAIRTSHLDVQAEAAHVVDSVAEAIAWVLQANTDEAETGAKLL
ncbi:HAD family hydrolase [Paenibacillus agricola]|uniref:HAD family hydrolase n=1 Tax=Paenibacillus agricola TaxID=2716264 RepID=A0ABX0J7I5_9BACL|nr:HAD family hydrolase [Paenibacillus agricola]NHN31578.1 HAD family hydrolase [Paenibacillus agricola]